MSELVQPNLHVALVHFPIALISVGTALEVLSFLGWRRSPARVAARWMILLGAILGMATATSGVYALADQREYISDDLAVGLRRHLVLGSLSVLATLIVCSGWIGSSETWRRRLYWPSVLILVAATGAQLAAAHISGELVYEQGLGVKQQGIDEATDATGWRGWIVAVMPPTQTHLIFAGFTFALAILVPGVASRMMNARCESQEPAEPPSVQGYATAADPDQFPDVAQVRPRACTQGLAWLAPLIGIVTAVAGVWIIAHSDGWNLRSIWHEITDRQMNGGRWLTRMLSHLIGGSSIIVLSLLTLGCARWAPRSRAVWWILSTLLLLAVAAQIWLGVLLLFDGGMGSVMRWNAP